MKASRGCTSSHKKYQNEGCKDWYHPACVGMTIEEAKKLDHFVCAECSSDDDVKKSQNGFAASPADDVKVRLFRIYKASLRVQKLEADFNNGIVVFRWKRSAEKDNVEGVLMGTKPQGGWEISHNLEPLWWRF
ncbi:unnamed protein product [Brassica napus]|uniref:(rape) hypothetical protein n=1 Tax=Brassica napus TaxID=3708 RepID=A0A816NBT5_BRANA|nr:unnamed protein product [Brassica napus]